MTGFLRIYANAITIRRVSFLKAQWSALSSVINALFKFSEKVTSALFSILKY